MKLLIIEGTDRVGKDTIIQRFLQEYPNSHSIHWSFPRGSTNEEKTAYQKTTFGFWMSDYRFKKKEAVLDLLIWNRSHIGECVYAPLYRNSDSSWVYDLEKEYLSDNDEVYLVLLYADPEFLIKHDDGQSYTDCINLKRIENEKFQTAFNNSKIKNKLKIKVNHGNDYSDVNDIYNIIAKTISI